VWDVPYRHRDRTVDVFVRKLREKLDRRSSFAYVHTHYGVGYRFGAEMRGSDAA
jgi:DNA-binding response OmpR family regulator